MSTGLGKTAGAAIATGAICWIIPALLVGVVPPAAGMIVMMLHLYGIAPCTAAALGVLAATSPQTLFWIPAALGVAFALLFPLAMDGAQDIAFYGIAYAAIGYIAMGARTCVCRLFRDGRGRVD